MTANKILMENEKQTIRNAMVSNMNYQRENSEWYTRAYHMAYEERPCTDNEALLKKWIRNGKNIAFKVIMQGND